MEPFRINRRMCCAMSSSETVALGPVASTRAPLVTEAANVILALGLSIQISESWNVDTVWPLTLIKHVSKFVRFPIGSHFEVMIHEIVTEFATVVAQAIRETIRFRIEQYEGRCNRRGAAEYHLGIEFDYFVRLGIDDPHTLGPFPVLVVKDLIDD